MFIVKFINYNFFFPRDSLEKKKERGETLGWNVVKPITPSYNKFYEATFVDSQDRWTELDIILLFAETCFPNLNEI